MEQLEAKPHIENEVSMKIAALPGMDKPALSAIWKQSFQSPLPRTLRKQLIVPILAYRLQELEYGGLSHTARKRLQGLIARNRAKPARRPKVSIPAEGSGKLVRTWRGEIHEVFLIESGYIYKGETFKTLSPIREEDHRYTLVWPGILRYQASGPQAMTETKRIRCAIYTRKSSEEGLDQSFNSLHAQREACEAYILSQRHEGWETLTSVYDDGGFSGGNMERPGLRRLGRVFPSSRVQPTLFPSTSGHKS